MLAPASETSLVGPYRLEHRLGRGGMGEVYAGFDTRLDRPVALKRIRPGSTDQEAARERFRSEARALASLRHPAIVQVYDWVETENESWIVMELVEGRSLRELLRAGPLPPDRTARLGRDILGGLAAAHRSGVIHRDLKAENVMVVCSHPVAPGDTIEQARILDFGLARRFGQAPTTTESPDAEGLIGTVSALAPEQILGRGTDHRADLFSFGSLLYEMLTGIPAFDAPTPGEVLQRICTSKVLSPRSRNPNIPEALSTFVDHLLEKDPRWRPQDATAALSELDQVLARLPAPETIPAKPQVPLPGAAKAGKPSLTTWLWSSLPTGSHRGRRLRSILVGFTLTLVLVLLALVLASGLRGPPQLLYVAVPPTTVMASSSSSAVLRDLELAASAVQTAILRGLAGLEDFVALEPTADVSGDPTSLARATAADEVFASSLECGDSLCQVVLRRLDGANGSVAWTRSFSLDPRNLLEISLATLGHFQGAYPDAERHPGVPDLTVEDGDYAAFLDLQHRLAHRETGLSSDRALSELERLQESSPGFLNLYLFEAMICLRRYQEGRDGRDLERAMEALARARGIAPGDTRLLIQEAQIARIGGRLEQAARALEAQRKLQPGNVKGMIQQALLLEQQARGPEALAQMRQAVRRLPSASHLLDFADMASRQGDTKTTRDTLEEVLARWPESYDVHSRLARFELLRGSPERAAELYEQLVRRSPESVQLTNLGTAYLLAGNFEASSKRFRQALELTPSSPFAALSVADTEGLLGHGEEARRFYRQVLKQTGPHPGSEFLIMVRAQALAHLGRSEEAVAAVEEALDRAPGNPQILYESALVHAVIGDRPSALDFARQALAADVDRRWFSFPWFDALRADLELPR